MTSTILFFAPHPDDETLGCGGTIAKRIVEGFEVIIVVMTDGADAFSNFTSLPQKMSRDELKQMRKDETISAVEVLGGSKGNVFFLDFEDGKLAVYSENVKSKIFEILNKFRPVEVYIPFEKDFHCDHKAASLILQDCVSKLDFATGVYRYSISQRFSAFATVITKIIAFFKHELVSVDVSRFVEQKAAAIDAYKSQVSIIFDGQTRPVVPNSKRFLNRSEVFFRYRQ